MDDRSLAHRVVLRERNLTASDSRLIGHDHDGNSSVIGAEDRGRRPWQQGDLRRLGRIVRVGDDRAVAVKKESRARHQIRAAVCAAPPQCCPSSPAREAS